MNNNLPQRKTPRANWIEYNEGMYFITICTKSKKHFFGQIINDVICLSQIGKYLDYVINETPKHQSYIEILQYVIMPNHLHLLVEVHSPSTDTACRVPTLEERMTKGIAKNRLPLLSTFVGSIKSAVTKYAHKINDEFAWQPRYHDHVIRNINDYNNISTYIKNNISNWYTDCFFI